MARDKQVDSAGLAKLTFVLDSGDWHGSATETLWARNVGPGLYQLDNSPFFALGVSYQDVVSAREEGGRLVFSHATARGGHSTYRVLLREPGRARLDELWSPLRDEGCTYEEGPGSLLSVDVPPGADIYRVYAILQAGEEAGAWTFEEGHCGHAVG